MCILYSVSHSNTNLRRAYAVVKILGQGQTTALCIDPLPVSHPFTLAREGGLVGRGCLPGVS